MLNHYLEFLVVLTALATVVNGVQRHRLVRTEGPASPEQVILPKSSSKHKSPRETQASSISLPTHQALRQFDQDALFIEGGGGVHAYGAKHAGGHSLVSMGQEDWMVMNDSERNSKYTRAPRHFSKVPAAWRPPLRMVPHNDALRQLPLSGSVVIQSSGSLAAAPSTGSFASLAQELQAPVATAAPLAAPVTVPAPVAAATVAPAVAPAVASAATVAPAAGAAAAAPPAAGAAAAAPVAVVPAAGAAPPASGQGGGSSGSMFLILALIAVIGAVASLVMRLRAQNRAPAGRLGGVQDANAGVDSQFWKSAKSRQSYRSTAISKSQASKGNLSTSDDDADSGAQKKSAGASAQDEASAKSGGSEGASPTKPSSYRDRRGVSKGPDSRSAAADSSTPLNETK